MKKLIYIPVLLFMAAFSMVSCDGLLNVDSERYTFDEEYRMGSEHDSLYSFVGILSQLQLLGDRYVLLGELRGDLMETGDDASRFLKQINEFNVTKDNPFASSKDYYSVINNCNYVIQYVDTSVIVKGAKTNYKIMAMAKAIRAWTYMQLVLNYGEARYIDKPIINYDDVTKTYETVGISELCDLLIDDLSPFYRSERIGTLNLGLFADFNSKYSVFPIRFILGDLYLWKGTILEGDGDAVGAKPYYENAATMYYNLMYRENAIISRSYTAGYNFTNDVATNTFNNWSPVYAMAMNETLGAIASSSDYGHQFTLDSLSFNHMIAPTENSIANWENQVFYYSTYATGEGDMRKLGSVSKEFMNAERKESRFKEPTITKFLNTSSKTQKVILIYRNSLLYLRYAEAVNRLGCPQLAFAALKTGLNSSVDANASIQKEITDKMGSVPSYMVFNSSVFSRTNTDGDLINIGIHARGSGVNLPNDTTYFKIAAGVDSIAYVEEKIVEELALETAYEGNRFHDLMRVALRRNDPSFLADKVSIKYVNKENMRTKLLDKKNWFLPK